MSQFKKQDETSKQVAYRILQALNLFKNEKPEIRERAEQIVMSRVQRFRSGEGNLVIDGRDLVREIPEPGTEPEINTSEDKPTGEDPEAL